MKLANFSVVCLSTLMILFEVLMMVSNASGVSGINSVKCENGYYLNDSNQCTVCQETCYQCTTGSECSKCTPNLMYMNTSTKLCEFCSEGEFYSSALKRCMDCEGSCSEECAYRQDCFICQNGQAYDLSANQCVDTCSEQQVMIQYVFGQDSISVCRGYEYYVNPLSSKAIELGTFEYPFKNVELVFVEILNVHSHTPSSITVHLIESELHYLYYQKNYIVNMTKVSFDSYSENPSHVPRRATLFVKSSSSISYFNAKTRFNIISNTTLDLSSVLSSGGLSTNEKDMGSYTNSAILISRTELELQNIDVYTDFVANSGKDTSFIRAFYLQEKLVKINDADFHINGRILRSTDPMSLYVENVYIDFYASNYPEAAIQGVVLINNVTIENSQTRIAPYRNGLLSYAGPANVTFTSINVLIYGSLSEDESPVKILLTTACNPEDDLVQTITLSNNYWTLPSNPSTDRYVNFYTDFDDDYIRALEVFYVNNTHEDIVSSAYPINFGLNNLNTNVYLTSNTYTRVSGESGIATIEKANQIIMDSVYYSNSSDFGTDIYRFLLVNSVDVTNLTISNVNGTGAFSDFYLYFLLNIDGQVTIDHLTFVDSDIGPQWGIYIGGIAKKFAITNSDFKNTKVGNENSLISTGIFKSFEMQNVTFDSITDSKTGDQDNFILSLDTIYLTDATNSILSNVTIKSSRLGFMTVNDIDGETDQQVELRLSDITYQNSDFHFRENLFLFSQLETQQDWKIIIDGINFQDLSFERGGYLILFEQQISNPIFITDLTIENVFAGYLTLESANKQNLDTKTQVQIYNSKFHAIDMNFDSMIYNYEGGFLEIYNSTFNQISCLEEGAIIYAGYQNTVTNIYNSTFTNNSAVEGALFNIEEGSVVRCYNCKMLINFAIIGGIVTANNNGYFELYSTIMFNNYALSSSVARIFSVASTPLFSNCTLYDNQVISVTEMLKELVVACQYLCFVPDTLKAYLLGNPAKYNIIASEKMFQVISGRLAITNSSRIYDVFSIVASFVSSIELSDINVGNIEVSDSCIRLAESTLQIKNMTAFNITENSSTMFIYSSFESELYVDQLSYHSSTASFLVSIASSAYLDGVNLMNVDSDGSVISIRSSTDMSITNSVFSSLACRNNSYPISIDSTNIRSLSNVSISNMTQSPLYIKRSSVDSANGLAIENCTSGVYVDNSNIDSLENSMFASLGAENYLYGGAIHLFNSNASISESEFINNEAIHGGAIYYHCSETELCQMSITDTTFEGNQAEYEGGAIKYTLYRPTLTRVKFNNNIASYGDNIASYPVRIGEIDGTDDFMFDSAVSGNKYSQSFTYGLFDYDDQIMNLDSISTIYVKAIIEDTSVSGDTNMRVTKGKAYFDDLTFKFRPGESNVPFSLTSNAINLDLVRKDLGEDYNLSNLTVNFRLCKPGEIVTNNECSPCGPGSYSLDWSAQECKSCLDNTYCEGEEQIVVDDGYWRRTTNSTYIAECFNDKACLGGYNPENKHPVKCEAGYSGVLCSKCTEYDGKRYEKITTYTCGECSSNIVNIVRLIGIIVAYLVAIVFIIYLRKKEGNQRTVLMRIFANYTQIMAAVLAYNLKLPDVLSEIFAPVNVVGSGSKTALSLDCFNSDSQFTLFTPSPAIYKIFVMAVMPIGLTLILMVFFGSMNIVTLRKLEEYKRQVIVSAIIILFLLHPALTESSFALFQCAKIDDGVTRVMVDLDIECYSAEHILWCMVLAFPMMVIWVFGSQILILIILIKKRKDLKNEHVKRYFAILYQGLNDRCFYWEFVNTLRKTLLVMLNVFLAQFPAAYKTLCAIILLILLLRVQFALHPYKLKINNECENLSMIAILLTVFGGLVFIDENESVAGVQVFSFLLIIIINFLFLLFWFYVMMMTYTKYKIAKDISTILRIVLMRNHTDNVFTETSMNVETPKPFPQLSANSHKVEGRLNESFHENQNKIDSNRRQKDKLNIVRPKDLKQRRNMLEESKNIEDSFHSLVPNLSISNDTTNNRHKFYNSINESKYVIEEDESLDVRNFSKSSFNSSFLYKKKKRAHYD